MPISGSFIQIKENQERLLKAKDFLPPVVRLFPLSVEIQDCYFLIMLESKNHVNMTRETYMYILTSIIRYMFA